MQQNNNEPLSDISDVSPKPKNLLNNQSGDPLVLNFEPAHISFRKSDTMSHKSWETRQKAI